MRHSLHGGLAWLQTSPLQRKTLPSARDGSPAHLQQIALNLRAGTTVLVIKQFKEGKVWLGFSDLIIYSVRFSLGRLVWFVDSKSSCKRICKWRNNKHAYNSKCDRKNEHVTERNVFILDLLIKNTFDSKLKTFMEWRCCIFNIDLSKIIRQKSTEVHNVIFLHNSSRLHSIDPKLKYWYTWEPHRQPQSEWFLRQSPSLGHTG